MEQVAAQDAAPAATRRRFYLTVIYGLWGLISAALSAPALVYLLLPPRVRQESEWVEATDITRLQLKTPIEVMFRKNRVDGWRVSSENQTSWVVKLSDQQVVAFGPQCTHLGCAYHWEERSSAFLCPCHSSVFSVDGSVISGPAQRPLDRYDTKIENGRLLLGALRQPGSQKS
jgi:menaquinol-cytochrome c reductase iron-sulfur subunit